MVDGTSAPVKLLCLGCLLHQSSLWPLLSPCTPLTAQLVVSLKGSHLFSGARPLVVDPSTCESQMPYYSVCGTAEVPTCCCRLGSSDIRLVHKAIQPRRVRTHQMSAFCVASSTYAVMVTTPALTSYTTSVRAAPEML